MFILYDSKHQMSGIALRKKPQTVINLNILPKVDAGFKYLHINQNIDISGEKYKNCFGLNPDKHFLGVPRDLLYHDLNTILEHLKRPKFIFRS